MKRVTFGFFLSLFSFLFRELVRKINPASYFLLFLSFLHLSSLSFPFPPIHSFRERRIVHIHCTIPFFLSLPCSRTRAFEVGSGGAVLLSIIYFLTSTQSQWQKRNEESLKRKDWMMDS